MRMIYVTSACCHDATVRPKVPKRSRDTNTFRIIDKEAAGVVVTPQGWRSTSKSAKTVVWVSRVSGVLYLAFS